MTDTDSALWPRLERALEAPLTVAVATGATPERYIFWSLADEKGPAIWSKPLQGEKQPRLPHRPKALASVIAAWRQTQHSAPAAYRDVTLRGHALFALLQQLDLLEQ